VVLVMAGLLLALGALNHAQTVSLDCVVGTWSHASVFVLAAIVAGLLVAAALLAAAAAGVRAADDRRKVETELERTYARLRAAEGAPASVSEPPSEGTVLQGAVAQNAERAGAEDGDAPVA
jgi:uncharacterized integral membrane protein